MAIDIRAKVTVSVGGTEYDVISGSISDEHVTNYQAVLTKGQCEIVGIHLIEKGVYVDVYYEKKQGGGTLKRRIPRFLRILSSTPDPLRNKTLLSLGCSMSYVKNATKDDRYLNLSDPADDGYGIIVNPINATKVINYCFSKIGLLFGGELDNKFSRPEIDVSGGYLNVAADLVASEGGYLVEYEQGRIGSARGSMGSSVPVLTANDLIDFQPLRANDSLPEGVEAAYSRVVLKEPDVENPARVNWEEDIVTGDPQGVTITYKVGPGDLRSLPYFYTPFTRTVTEYDLWNRVKKKVTTERVIGAQIAASWIHQAMEYAASSGGVGGGVAIANIGSKEYEIITTQEVFYKIKAPEAQDGLNSIPKPGYDEIEREVTTRVEPAALLQCSVASAFVDDNNNLIPLATYPITASITTVTYEQQKRFAKNLLSIDPVVLKGIGMIPVNKTITEYKKCYGYTNEGQQDLARRVAQGQFVSEFFVAAVRLAVEDTEVRTSSGREVMLQARPDENERILAAYIDSPVTNILDNGFTTEQEVGTAISGEAGENSLKINIPFVHDDLFVRVGIPPNVEYTRTSYKSKADSNARNYARNALKIARGTSNGAAIVTTPERLGSSQLSIVSVKLGGFFASYMQNGTTYTFDDQGIVASTDGVLLSGLGQLPDADTQWFPTAAATTFYVDPPTTTLTPAIIGTIATVSGDPQVALSGQFPTASNSEGVYETATDTFWVKDTGTWANKGSVLGLYVDSTRPTPLDHNFVALKAHHLTSIVVASFAYGMTLPLISVTLKTGTKLQADKILKVEPPVAAVTVMANAPAVAIGAAIAVPAASLTVSGVAPDVVQSTVVTVPTAIVTLAGFAPQQAGSDGTVVTVPLAAITLAGVMPEQAGPDTDTFFNSYYRQVYGWEQWIFPDWWAD